MTTISIRDLAEELADQYDTDLSATQEAVRTYAGQIDDDAELWDGDAEELTKSGANIVRAAFATTQGDDSMDALMSEIIDAQAAVNKHNEQLARRDAAIRAAMKGPVSAEWIAQVSGLTRARVYQIRDGRR